MSQGPLIPLPEIVFRTLPQWSRTIRQPALAVGDMPFLVGRLPTTTQPSCRMLSAVVSPTPPGQELGRLDWLMVAKTLTFPLGETWTIVVPVPWKFLELLKLLTSTLPRTRRPWLRWTTAVPYGLTSPLAGTVDAIVVFRWNFPMNDLPLL